MTQNTSMAVMQNRKNTKASLDFFPTPPWATRALCRELRDRGFTIAGHSCWEPACGQGHMVRPLREVFKSVHASDCQPYGWDHFVIDFLLPQQIRPETIDWVITNPPFKSAEDFILAGLRRARIGVAMLVRSAFIEGQGRYQNLFMNRPPALVFQFTERVPMVEGRCDPKASSATAYLWLVWLKRPYWEISSNGNLVTQLRWIAPCRKELERPEDYLPMGGQNG